MNQLRLCSGCNLVHFCSDECARRAWKEMGHKAECKAAAAGAAGAAAAAAAGRGSGGGAVVVGGGGGEKQGKRR